MEKKGLTYWAYKVLYVGFIAAPILAGVDKFFNFLTDWSKYLSPLFADIIPLGPVAFMRAVGVVEITAGVLVAVKPRVGGLIVSAWLFGIIINLVTIPGFYDVALRDLGLALGALALSLLSGECQCA